MCYFLEGFCTGYIYAVFIRLLRLTGSRGISRKLWNVCCWCSRVQLFCLFSDKGLGNFAAAKPKHSDYASTRFFRRITSSVYVYVKVNYDRSRPEGGGVKTVV